MDRHGRQTRLAGLGPVGQARIGRAHVEIREAGWAGQLAAAYLAGAGVGLLIVGSPELEEIARAVDPSVQVRVQAHMDPDLEAEHGVATYGLRHPSARELARGARAALLALRGVLESS